MCGSSGGSFVGLTSSKYGGADSGADSGACYIVCCGGYSL